MEDYANGAEQVKASQATTARNNGKRGYKRPQLTDEQRLALRTRMGLVTTDDLIDALGVSKETLARYRRDGLRQYGSKQKFYRLDDIADVIAKSGTNEDSGDAPEA